MLFKRSNGKYEIIMKKLFLFLFLFFLNIFLISCTNNNEPTIVDLKTKFFKISISDKGSIIDFTDLKTNKNYLEKDTTTSLMSLRINNEIKVPQSAKVNNDVIILNFENNIEANIKVEEKDAYLTFELISLTKKEAVDLILWGPYYSTINKVIGETVGVVRGEEYAVGIQSLNIKTLGGYPWNESDRMPQFDVFREEDINNMHPKSDGSVLYRIEAAKPTNTGSSLQAYCRNRNKDRIIQDFSHDRIVAPAYDDGGVIGSKIALFGCPVEKSLETIGEIEVAEGLPHPIIDGKWGKTSADAASAYLITNFTEDNVKQAIELTKKAGLRHLYHYGKTFENWGQFDLYKGEFPNGVAGLKKCVEKAEAQGIMVGTHCLSNFITTNDPYVTPIPDKRLAKVGSSVIINNIDAKETEILIQSPDFFNQMKNNNLKTVVIGSELIRYGNVSDASPWKLLDCQRGAYETMASEHKSGEEISKLLDHPYNVFLTNTDLTIEMSETLAKLYNQTGMRQISFDGLEGNRSTGLGTYGESLMPYVWYNSLSDDLKNNLIIDASRTTHFFWHIYSRMNWGEPWYGGFRESHTEYRFKNQAYFKRNFMPGMLGWFKMTPETTLEDIEWMLARSAGYDAGYAFVANMEEIEKNGNSNKILELIGDWEKLRIGGSFTEAQKEILKDNDKEFSIKRINDNEWNLHEVNSEIFNHEKKVRQPGEPLYSTFAFNNIGNEQSVNFILSAIDSDANEITMELNNYKKIKLPAVLRKGQTIKYSGGNKAIVYDSNWQIVREFDINPSDFKVSKGENSVAFDCNFDKAEKEARVKLEIRTFAEGEKIVSNR
ncbi:hypothetical protein ACFL02_03745 [Planctomycetota bacterium]